MSAEPVYIGLGSNQGDRLENLSRSLRRVVEILAPVRWRASPVYETAPVGLADGGGAFLNAVAELLISSPSPDLILAALLEIEAGMGRRRGDGVRSRVIDLDLLLVGGRVVASPGLTLPHPRLHQRRFVLAPLADLAPDLRHPLLGSTVAEMLSSLPPGEQPVVVRGPLLVAQPMGW